MDVDGSLTDGKIYMGPNGEAMKAFSIKDGYAVNYILKPHGIVPVVLTARNSAIVQNRCNELGIHDVYQGKLDKLAALREIIGEPGLGSCAYFGDDIIDLQCMIPIKEARGKIGCPADAVREVKAASDYVCAAKAGEGALREFSEWLVSEHTDTDILQRRIHFAIQHIRSLDMSSLRVGTYPVNDFFYYSVQEYYTKDKQNCIAESHRKYVDVQWMVEGEEKILVSDISRLAQQEEYNEETDISLWRSVENMMQIVLQSGTYTVLYPENVHMGCVALYKSTRVKKIVGKIKVQ